jgi:hypothetical protein
VPKKSEKRKCAELISHGALDYTCAEHSPLWFHFVDTWWAMAPTSGCDSCVDVYVPLKIKKRTNAEFDQNAKGVLEDRLLKKEQKCGSLLPIYIYKCGCLLYKLVFHLPGSVSDASTGSWSYVALGLARRLLAT